MLLTALKGGSATACLIFGVLADLIPRKKAAIITLTISAVGLAICAISLNYFFLLIGELLLGFGSGGYIPVAQAIIGDATPTKDKGKIYGWASNITFIGFFVGIIFTSAFSSFWKIPFAVSLIPLLSLIILYGFKGKQYKLGEHDIKSIHEDKNYVYNYQITLKSFKKIIQNKTNVLIFIEGIFSVLGISMIIMYFFPFLVDGPAHLSPFIGSIILFILVTPFQLIGVYFWGKIGDKLINRYPRIRIILIALSFTITTPIFIMIFWIQGSPATETATILDALMNPGILTFTIFFAFGSFFLGMYDPNQPPIINEINLPEMRGSVFALNRFVEELGGAIGPLLVGLFFEMVGQNYSLAMTFGMLFMIPGTVCWWLALKTYTKDRINMHKIIENRVRNPN